MPAVSGTSSVAARAGSLLAGIAIGASLSATPAAEAASLLVQYNPVEVVVDAAGCENLCWAATTANAIAYTGWGVDHDGDGIVSGQTVFNEMLPVILEKYGDVPGSPDKAGRIYFDLHQGEPRFSGYVSAADWLWRVFVTASSLTPGDRVVSMLENGAAPIVGIELPGGGRHAINAWGYEIDRTGQVIRLLVVDQAADSVQRVDYDPQAQTISNLYRFQETLDDLPVKWAAGVRSLDRWVDVTVTNATDQPVISRDLAEFIAAIPPTQTGLTDAPIVGFNGVPLTAADTGWDFLTHEPGPAVADQVVGNGIDDLTAFSFFFPSFETIDTALLTLELTAKSPAIVTDLLLFSDLSPQFTAEQIISLNLGNDLLSRLQLDVRTSLTFDLSALSSVFGPLDLRHLLRDGDLNVLFGDDAIIHWASLRVTGTLRVPEPSSLLLLFGALAAFALTRRRAGVYAGRAIAES